MQLFLQYQFITQSTGDENRKVRQYFMIEYKSQTSHFTCEEFKQW